MSASTFPSACDLRTRIEIQRFTESVDAIGGRSRTWGTIETCWASYEEGKGKEISFADGKKSIVWATLYIRYTDITAKDRILIDGLPVNISSVNDIQRRKMWLKITLEEGAAT